MKCAQIFSYTGNIMLIYRQGPAHRWIVDFNYRSLPVQNQMWSFYIWLVTLSINYPLPHPLGNYYFCQWCAQLQHWHVEHMVFILTFNTFMKPVIVCCHVLWAVLLVCCHVLWTRCSVAGVTPAGYLVSAHPARPPGVSRQEACRVELVFVNWVHGRRSHCVESVSPRWHFLKLKSLL